MFRRLLPLGLIALAAVVGLTGTAVAQVETNDSDVRESRGASALHDSQGVIGELINAVAEADLELRKCSLTATPAGGESLAELSVTASGVADVKRLIEGLRRKKQVLVEQLAMKPSAPTATPSAPVLFDLVLRLEPQEASPAAADALSRLAPFDGLPGFNLTEPALSGVHLYSCSIKASGPRSLQLVAPRLADLSELVRKEAGAAPASSKTISSSLIGAARVFTLDLSDDSAFLPVGDLLALFERLAKVCDPKEITVQMAPDGSRLLKMGIQAASARMADIGSLLASEERSIVIKADAVPAAVPDWAVTLLVGSSGAANPVQAERPVAPLADFTALLDAPWPASQRDRLRFSWTPGAIQMTATVTDERDVESLKPVAKTLGMTYQGAKRQESIESGALTVGFGRELAAGGPGALVSLDAPLGRFLGFAELLEDTAVRDGHRLVVACDFTEMPRLVEALQGDIGKRLQSLTMDCHPGARCRTTLMLAPQTRPEAAAMLNTVRALIGAPLFWNRPESDLAGGLIVTGLKMDDPERFAVMGMTLKSRLIFSDLFPALEKIPGVTEPFFRQGSYSDHNAGRLMNFEVTARRRSAP